MSAAGIRGPRTAYLEAIRSARADHAFEGHKRIDHLLRLCPFLFPIEVQRCQDRPISDSKQIGAFRGFMVHAGPGGRHEAIVRFPLKAHPIDDGMSAALKDDIDGAAGLAPGGCARAGIQAMHLAGKGTLCRASGERVNELQATYRVATRLVQRFERALGFRPAGALPLSSRSPTPAKPCSERLCPSIHRLHLIWVVLEEDGFQCRHQRQIPAIEPDHRRVALVIVVMPVPVGVRIKLPGSMSQASPFDSGIDTGAGGQAPIHAAPDTGTPPRGS